MKYFNKIAATVTTVNTPKVVATPKQPGVQSRTTPRRSIGKNENTATPMKIDAGQNTNVNKPGQASIGKTAKLKDDFSNLKYVLKHKAYIVGPGHKLGLRLGQVLRHDNSKFSKEEWKPYRDYFFSEKGLKGSNDPEVYMTFRNAVENSHYKKNPHHNAGDKPIKYRVEAVVDWYAAAKAQSANPRKFPSFEDWYMTNRQRFLNSPSNVLDENLDFYIQRQIMLK